MEVDGTMSHDDVEGPRQDGGYGSRTLTGASHKQGKGCVGKGNQKWLLCKEEEENGRVCGWARREGVCEDRSKEDKQARNGAAGDTGESRSHARVW